MEDLVAVVAAVDSPALVFDSQGIVLAINDSAERLLGVSSEFIVGQTVELTNSLYVPGDVRSTRNHSINDERKAWEGDWLKVHSSGQELPSHARAVPLTGTDYILEVIHPTEEASSSEDLEWRLMNGLLDLAPSALLILGEGPTILYANPAFERRYNRSRQLKHGTPLSSFIDDTELQELLPESGPRSRRRHDRTTTTVTTPDGEKVPIRLSTVSVSSRKQSDRFVLAAFEDASEIEGAWEDAAMMIQAARRMSEPLLLSDPAGILFFGNPAATVLFGLNETELVGRNVADFLGEGCIKGAETEEESIFPVKISDARTEQRTVSVFPVSGRAQGSIAYGWLIRLPAPKG